MNRRLLAPAIVIGLGLAVGASTAVAQSWREITSSRVVRGEAHLDVAVEFASGTFRLHPGSQNQLYRIDAMYDEDSFESTTRFDAGATQLQIGITPRDLREGPKIDDESPQYLDVALSTAVPLSLDLKFGAAQSAIELGGLSIRRVNIKTGATSSSIGFDRANQIACEALEIAVGAAELVAEGLGYARCQTIKLAGGAGEVTLDFTGRWDDTFVTSAEIMMGLGVLNLRIPEDVGVELRMSRLFASFDRERFEKRGANWVSTNYDQARATLQLHIRAVLGEVNVEWIPVGPQGASPARD
jgi:hypothetical protein